MAGNKERGEVDVSVEGVTYTLRPTFDSLCQLETMLDKPIDQILKTVQEGRVSGLRAVVWCLLQENHGARIRTLKDASQWIESFGTEAALDAVYRCFRANSDDLNERSAADPPTAQAGTFAGSSSAPGESA